MQTPAERYDTVMEDLQMIGQRNMLCGLHVHVELPDPDDRVDIMMRMLPYLPLFIALADLLAVLARAPDRAEGLPARGLRRVAAHRRAGTVPHAGRIRVLHRGAGEGGRDGGFELRVVGDPAVAASIRRLNCARPTRARWSRTRLRSQRSTARSRGGYAQSVAELGPDRRDPRDRRREQVARAALRRARHLRRYLRQWRDLGRRPARAGARGCRSATRRRSAASKEIEHCRSIVGSGTSADTQLAVFEQAQGGSEDRDDALRAVTDWLAEATLQ